MDVYLAGTYSREVLFRDGMPPPLYVLESFYYVKPWQIKRRKEWKDFLLDSGAFTFLSSKRTVDWRKYVEAYADFIVQNQIENFFELDIDSIVGFDNVLRMRRYLEGRTGRKCIPVWHRTRGLKDFYLMCDNYKRVAIGGIVSREIPKKEYKIFSHLIREAHARGTKVHGLGFTSLKDLSKYHFDSVDSTSWLSASRFGQIHYFNGETIKQRTVKDGEKTVHYQKMDDFVFSEWVKFQRYAEVHL